MPTAAQVSVSTSGEKRWDTIVWLDHRALAEADECTATGHRVLDHLGGVMSPEMATPKLMWLKRHLPESWNEAGYLFDLADFLTCRASGSIARSQCTLTCKWTYLAHEKTGWQQDFFEAVGLDDMLERGQLPGRASPVGTDLGPLTARSAQDLGLTEDCRVATGVIDAYAGALGLLGGFAGDPADLDRHLALIAGTSSCVMALSPEPRSFPGGWGPYFGAALPGCWISEGGQSATGALLDHVVRLHGAGGEPDARAAPRDRRAHHAAARSGGPRSRRPPACAARLPRQPLAACRSACARRDQRPDARRLLRQPVPPLLAHLRRHRARHPPHPRDAQRQRLRHRHAARDRRPHQEPAADGALRRRHPAAPWSSRWPTTRC